MMLPGRGWGGQPALAPQRSHLPFVKLPSALLSLSGFNIYKNPMNRCFQIYFTVKETKAQTGDMIF